MTIGIPVWVEVDAPDAPQWRSARSPSLVPFPGPSPIIGNQAPGELMIRAVCERQDVGRFRDHPPLPTHRSGEGRTRGVSGLPHCACPL
ncbi:hypothetical protein [Sphingomonas sp. PP-CC-3A-396]|uniref:hypothetical protein n=1 Tax=Sphingomonas sp. PP-CC-3A-396 TaxID=2135655 RepID=UPI0010507327|nr:hypothetical protein [Sphingomonas sp. PP-CC-3A-396]